MKDEQIKRDYIKKMGDKTDRKYISASRGNVPQLARYNARMLPELEINHTVRLRKPHPCGSYEWRVTRLGADIGLECLGCGRRVMLTRRELSRRLKSILPKENDNDE